MEENKTIIPVHEYLVVNIQDELDEFYSLETGTRLYWDSVSELYKYEYVHDDTTEDYSYIASVKLSMSIIEAQGYVESGSLLHGGEVMGEYEINE